MANDNKDWEKKDNEQTRPPEGQTFNYTAFLLSEIFTVDHIHSLKKGLNNLLNNEVAAKTLQNNLSRDLLSLRGGSWYRIGGLISEASKDLDATYRGIPNQFDDTEVVKLPEGICRLDFYMAHKIPSFFILTTLVRIEKKTSDSFQDIFLKYHKSYEEPIPSDKIIRIHMPSNIKERQAKQFSDALQLSIENYLAKAVKGFFLSKKQNNCPILPKIEIYTLDNIPTFETDGLKEWLKQHNDFLRCCGFESAPWEVYRYDNFLVSQYMDTRGEGPLTWKVLCSRKWKGNQVDEYNIEYMVWHSFVKSIELLSLQEYISHEANYIVKFRKPLVKKTLSKNITDEQAREYSDFVNKRLDFEKIKGEITDLISTPKLALYGVPEFVVVEVTKTTSDNFCQYLLQCIGYGLNTVGKEFDVQTRRFETLFNIAVTHSSQTLQRRIAWLTWFILGCTIALFIVGIVSLIVE